MLRQGLRLLLAAIALLPVLVLAQVTDATNINDTLQRSWPAGPYSEVSTGNGTLRTTVPFFSLDGPGDSSMSFGIYHRSNPVSGATYPNTLGYAGRGWQPTTSNFVDAGGSSNGVNIYTQEMRQVMAGNSVNYFTPIYGGYAISGGSPRAGVRCSLQKLTEPDGIGNDTGPNVPIIGWEVTDNYDHFHYYYENQDYLRPTIWHLTRVVDCRDYAPDSEGHLVIKGNTVTYQYDTFERVVKITDAAGRYATFNWGAGTTGQLQSVSLFAGSEVRTWNLVYSTLQGSSDVLTGVEMPPATTGGSRPTVHFDYNSNDSLSDVYDPRGAHWHYTYSALPGYGLVAGAVYEPQVASPGNYDPNNPTLFYYYTNNGNSAAVGSVGTTTFPLQPHTFTAAIVDRLGEVWRHEYDYGVDVGGEPSSWNQIVPNDWLGSGIRRIYDPIAPNANGVAWGWYESYKWNYFNGTLIQYIDREGRVTDMQYLGDQRGLCSKKTQYLGSTPVVWQYIYDSVDSRLYRQTSPEGIVTLFGYEFVGHSGWSYTGRLNSVRVDPIGPTLNPTGQNLKTNYTYNAQGDLASTWTGTDSPTVYSGFDAEGNASTVTDPAGNVTTRTFDVWGNKKTEQPPSPSGLTSFDYDNYDRLIQTTLPGGATVGATYDLNGNVTTARKEDGTLVTTAYDALNRPTSVTQPTGSQSLVTSFGYNLRGEKTSITNPRGKVTYYDFDDRGKLWRIRYPDLTNRQFAYDGTGNRLWVQNGRGQKTWFGYDSLGRLTGIDYPSSADVSYTYGLDGRRSSMTDGTGTSTYTYDTAGRMKTETQGLTGKTFTTNYLAGTNRPGTLSDGAQTWTTEYDSGLRVSTIKQAIGSVQPVWYTYNPNGSVAVRTFRNNTKTLYDYDARGRTTGMTHKTAFDVVQQALTYGYGPDGNLLTYTDNFPGAATWTTTYGHDLADRLTSEVRTGGANGLGNYSQSYGYDGQGNRTFVDRSGAISVYGTPGDNDQFTTGEGYTFSNYDADGNPGTIVSTNGTSMTLSYDEANRVTNISGTGASTFRYDGLGRRVERITGGVTTRFVYSGDQVRLETNGSNAVTIYRLPGVGVCGPGFQRYEQDSSLGSVLTTRDGVGGELGRTEFDAFGREVYMNGAERGSYRFAGAHGYANDDATGMQLLGARYYLPSLGRFLTQDPIGQEGGLNLYAYCHNSPLSSVDPSGLTEITLRFSELIANRWHSYLVVRDNVEGSKTFGRAWRIDGGPSRGAIWSFWDRGIVQANIRRIGARDSGGKWVFEGKSRFDIPLLNDQSQASGWLSLLSADAYRLQGMQQSYQVTNQNSNTFTHTLLQDSGLESNLNSMLQGSNSRYRLPILWGWSNGFHETLPWWRYGLPFGGAF